MQGVLLRMLLREEHAMPGGDAAPGDGTAREGDALGCY